MNSLHELIAGVSTWLWPRFADHLWQTTLVFVLILLATFAYRRGPARARHTLWLLASLKFLVPAALLIVFAQQSGLNFLNPFSTSQQDRSSERLRGFTEPVSVLIYDQDGTFTKDHNELYCVLSGVWLSGCTVLLLTWGIRSRRFLKSLRFGPVIDRGSEWDALNRARASLGFNGKVDLVISPLKVEPGVWRTRSPLIVLPESIASHLDDSELQAIMLHELVHIQRRDNLVGSIQLAVCTLFWFHPLVWFVGRKLFDEREQACDEKVLEICGTPETYAASILKVVRFSFGWRVTGVTGAGSGSNLRRRIENIMSNRNTKRHTGPLARVLTAALLGTAVVLMIVSGLYSRPRNVEASANAADIATPVSQNVSGEIARDEVAATGGNASVEKKGKASRPPKPPPPPAPSAPPPPPAKDTSDQSAAPNNEPATDKQKIAKGGLIEAPNPVYPEEAKKQKVEGRVSVEITIDETGKVISARATSGPELLQPAAEEAARKARFRPTTLKGEPVKVSGALSYNFVLKKPETEP